MAGGHGKRFYHSSLALLFKRQYPGPCSKSRLKATIFSACNGSYREQFLSDRQYETFRIPCHASSRASMVGTPGQSSIISSPLRGLVCIVMPLIPQIPTLSTTSSGFHCFLSTSELFLLMILYRLLDLIRNSSRLLTVEQPGNRYSKTFPTDR